MASDERRRDDALDRFWDGLVDGTDPEPEELSAETAEIVRRLRALGEHPDPSRARVRVWRRLATDSSPNGPVRSAALPLHRTPVPRPSLAPRSRPSSPLAPGRRAVAHWPMPLATALLLILTIGAVSVALLASRPPGGNAADWPTVRGNPARTGAVSGPGVATAPQLAWSVDLAGRVGASPIAGGGLIYVGTTEVVALDAATGAERWRIPMGASVGPLALDGDRLFVASADGTLSALDARTGAEAWSASIAAAPGGGPLATGGAVYLLGADGTIIAFDRADGHRRWQTTVTTATVGSGALALANGTLVATLAATGAVALDARTGAIRWRAAITDPYDEAFDPPVIAAGRVFVVSRVAQSTDPHGAIDVFDLATGKALWRFSPPGAGGLLAPIAVSGDTVVAAGNDGSLRTLDAATGVQRWRVPIGAPVTQAVTVSNGQVFVLSADRVLRALWLRDGAAAWQIRVTSGNLTGGVAVTATALLGATANGVVVAYWPDAALTRATASG